MRGSSACVGGDTRGGRPISGDRVGLALPGPVLVGFEETYVREGRDQSYTIGVDIVMDAGDAVPCLTRGGVVFAGTVPAGPVRARLP